MKDTETNKTQEALHHSSFYIFITENFKHLKVDGKIQHNHVSLINFQNLSLANFISSVFFTHFPLKIILKKFQI